MSIDLLGGRDPSMGSGADEQTSLEVAKELIESVAPGYLRTDVRRIEIEGQETFVNRYETKRLSENAAALTIQQGSVEFEDNPDAVPGQAYQGTFLHLGGDGELVRIDAKTLNGGDQWGQSKQAISFTKIPESRFTDADTAALDTMRNDLASIETETGEPLQITTTGPFGTGRSIESDTSNTHTSVSGNVFTMNKPGTAPIR